MSFHFLTREDNTNLQISVSLLCCFLLIAYNIGIVVIAPSFLADLALSSDDVGYEHEILSYLDIILINTILIYFYILLLLL